MALSLASQYLKYLKFIFLDKIIINYHYITLLLIIYDKKNLPCIQKVALSLASIFMLKNLFSTWKILLNSKSIFKILEDN